MKPPHTIDADHLTLRRHTTQDLDAFTAFLADSDAVQYMAFTPEQKKRVAAEAILCAVIDAYDSREPIYSFTIADAETDQYMGSCGLHRDHGGGFELYFTVLPECQGNGYGTEAARAVCEFAANDLHADRIVAYVVAENTPSVRVLEKLGFINDGQVARKANEAGMIHAEMTGVRYILRPGRQKSS